MSRLRAVEGTADILPGRIAAADHVAAACRPILARFGYREIRTPLFESRAVFERALGDEGSAHLIDLSTPTRGDVALALRPAHWPGVGRAYLQAGFDKTRPLQRLFSVGPVVDFGPGSTAAPRQLEVLSGVALGAAGPMLDAETIVLAQRCLAAIGITDTAITVNTSGDGADQARHRAALRAHFEPILAERCDACRTTFATDPTRLLACDAKACQPSNRTAPAVVDSLSESTRRRLQQTLGFLRAAQVPYAVDAALVGTGGGTTHTVFEVRCQAAGEGPLCCGGRRDDLLHALDGPRLGAVEFTIDLTQAVVVLDKQRHPAVVTTEVEVDAFVVPTTDAARKNAFVLALELRAAGIAADTDHEERPLKTLQKHLDKLGMRFLLFVGDDTTAAVRLRDRGSGDESDVPHGDVVSALRQRLST